MRARKKRRGKGQVEEGDGPEEGRDMLLLFPFIGSRFRISSVDKNGSLTVSSRVRSKGVDAGELPGEVEKIKKTLSCRLRRVFGSSLVPS